MSDEELELYLDEIEKSILKTPITRETQEVYRAEKTWLNGSAALSSIKCHNEEEQTMGVN